MTKKEHNLERDTVSLLTTVHNLKTKLFDLIYRLNDSERLEKLYPHIPSKSIEKLSKIIYKYHRKLEFMFAEYSAAEEIILKTHSLTSISDSVAKKYLNKQDFFNNAILLIGLLDLFNMQISLLEISLADIHMNIDEYLNSPEWHQSIDSTLRSATLMLSKITSSLISVFAFHNLQNTATYIISKKSDHKKYTQIGHEVLNRDFLYNLILESYQVIPSLTSTLCNEIYKSTLIGDKLFRASMLWLQCSIEKPYDISLYNKDVADMMRLQTAPISQLHNLITNYFSLPAFIVERWIVAICDQQNIRKKPYLTILNKLEEELKRPLPFEESISIGNYLISLLRISSRLSKECIRDLESVSQTILDLDGSNPNIALEAFDSYEPLIALNTEEWAIMGDIMGALLTFCQHKDSLLSIRTLLGSTKI